MNNILRKAIKSSWLIIKLVIPFSIASDILQYYGIIDSLSFIFEPFTNSLNLPSGTALSFASAIFFNLYAGIAVASTLNLNSYEWTVVGTFMAICHSLPLEAAILKKVGMSLNIHLLSRLILGYLGALIAMHITPNELNNIQESIYLQNNIKVIFSEFLIDSLYNSCLLALKVISLVVSLVLLFELIKKNIFFNNLLITRTYLSSLLVGGLLGITYGAGVLLQEIHKVKEKEKLLLLTFLMLAHGLIEETFIFSFVKADILIIFLIRIIVALIVVFFIYASINKRSEY